jgi:purine-nucleoside phosphorylase
MDGVAVSDAYAQATQAANHLLKLLPKELNKPQFGIVCGSGLGDLADSIHPDPKFEIPFVDIPNFPPSTGMLCPYRMQKCCRI